jgi:protein crumbs
MTDGHECVTKATFNGSNNTILYQPQLSNTSAINSISAKFRTTTEGTLLHVEGINGNHLKIGVKNGQVDAILPLSNSMRNLTFGVNITDGLWHEIKIENHGGMITGSVDGNKENDYYLEDEDTQLDILSFMLNSRIAVGSELNLENFFRGCVEEIRIGDVLLPYFTETEMVNMTSANRFVVTSNVNLIRNECVLCYADECANSGFCANPSDKFECTCPAGFEGGTCSMNIDECRNSSCVHGSCVDGINQYSCDCELGWIGDLCDTDKDECEDEPCKNGGSCVQREDPGKYICTCTEEYKGDDCTDLRVRTCNEAPCVNGGTCSDYPSYNSSDRFQCDCPQGYEKPYCLHQTNFCTKLNAICRNGGTCVSDFSSFDYQCLCQDGYDGKDCEHNIDDCASKPCKNNGICTDLVNRFTCDCSGSGFAGLYCEKNINECLSNPCENGAECQDTPGDYSCLCPGNYCGKNCQRLNPCLQNRTLCENSGACVPNCDLDPFYSCSCNSGWEGPSCNLKSSSSEELALIVGPIIGGMAFIALIGLLIFLVMARRKRKGEGHYRPAKQELTSPRLQPDTVLKVPPEERLI